jgi:stage II sporulation protein D
MRRALLPSIVVVLLVLPSGASAAVRQIVRGGGFGHGVGMSQYGAYGYARHGADYKTILAHYFNGTDLSTAGTQPVRVLLQSNRKTASFTGATDAPGHKLDPARTYKIRLAGLAGEELLDSRGSQIGHYDGPVQVTSSNGVVQLLGTAINGMSGGHYRDALEFRPSPFGGIAVVNAVALDDYVKGVVPGESPASWPPAALQAQAVAARSYALATDAGGAVFDQYPDTRSQVYRGADGEQASTNAAVDATVNQVLRYQGQVAATYFFSTSGGETEDVQNVFYGAQPQPYLTAVDDPYDNSSPKHRWRFVLSTSQMQSRLGSLVKGRFRGIKVIKRGVSPRIVWADVVGSRGRTRVRGATLKARLRLYDTWAYFNRFRTEQRPRVPGGGAPSPGAAKAANSDSYFRIPARTGRPAEIYGSVTPAPQERLAKLQRQGADGRWRTVGRVRLSRRGAYRAIAHRLGTYRVAVGPLVGDSLVVR